MPENFVKEYWSHVFEHALEDYQQGRTPNPDLLCNKEIKFDRLLDHLQQMQAKRKSWLVTGHYARLVQEQTSEHIHLMRGKDPIKDQTYYLATVPTFKFKNVIFPLGNLLKPQIKTIARNIGLGDIADQPESMGICFVGKRRNFTSFLGNYIQETPGSICTVDGTVIGQHQGLWTHTIGQRLRISYKSQKWYVSAKDIPTNVITVVPGRNHPALYSTALQLPNFSWSSKPSLIDLDEGTLVLAKIRSTQMPIKCHVRSNSASRGMIDIQFVEPVWAPAPGQYVVLYTLEGICLGAGVVPYYTI
ncbi:hypothetical protein DSO57_1009363 [Entomophthora muscae]|uniref:Uncharacterized protein n=1 Tax=Entomophthora muscae TaxID=34485 RepID=A0ACC2TUK0_9FUNG|nr:hypothetical protein DSO57_1009363 [Entomophthora muscae]